MAGIMVSRWMSGCLSVCLSIVHPSVRFSLPDDNLSKHQWIFTQSGVFTDIMEIWYGIANGQISSNFDGIICPIFFFILGQNLSKSQGILTKLGMCIDMKEIWFRIAKRQVSSMFDSVICLRHYNGGVF